MKKESIRKIILAFIILFILIFIGIDYYNIEKSFINDIKQETFYDEEDVENLEYILKEYYSNEYTEEDLKKAIIFTLKEEELNKIYYYRKDDYNNGLQDYINEKLTYAKNDRNDYSHDMIFNDQLIKQGDYHTLAITLLKSYNEQEIIYTISDRYEETENDLGIVLVIVFFMTYMYVILKFAFLTIFDKKTYTKKIIKFVLTILAIALINILIQYILELLLSLTGYITIINISEIYNYGIFDIITVIIIIIVSIIINCLLNIKDIIKHFKTKKIAKK